VSANGAATSSIRRNNDGHDIGIVDNLGNDIVRIHGGQRGRVYIDYNPLRDSRPDVGETQSNYPAESVDTLQIIPTDTTDKLGVRAAMLLKNMGSKGTPPGGSTSGGAGTDPVTGQPNWRSLNRWSASQSGDLFIAFKDDTPNPITWLTDNPTPPYWHQFPGGEFGHGVLSRDYFTLGYAIAITLR